MDFYSFKQRVGICNLVIGILLMQIPTLVTYAQSSPKPILPKLSSKQLLEKELCNIAKPFTVRVQQGNYWGSGILAQKQGTQYTIVTNGHVLTKEAESYTIETYDGKKHRATLLVRFDHGKLSGTDLAILQFNSPANYEVAIFSKWAEREKVMAAGFPLDASPSLPRSFMCSQYGQVSRRLEQPMQNGYQLGYFLNIRQGMSGGPLLNGEGKVVGINGMSNPAIFINPDLYLYRNGKRVSESFGLPHDKALNLLSTSSWAISSEDIVYLSPSGLNLKITSNETSNSSN
jgi:S1-C subfamily serine protease